MNQHPARKRHIIATVLVVISFGLLDLGVFINNRQQDKLPLERITCVLDIKEHDDTTRGLVNGYNYALLRRFATDYGIKECNVTLAGKDERLLDSLRNGFIDIVVMPAMKLEESDNEFAFNCPGDSSIVWAVRPDHKKIVKSLNKWIPDNTDSTLHNQYFNTFNNPLNVARYGIKREFLSPYDSLFKVYAPQIGWDWRLLAAIAWQESRFHIEAHSHRGASGLMQMMPGTADFISADNLLDPENSIRASAEYLSWIKRLFSRKALDRNELVRFTLAAYNAGHGRFKDCINYAQYREVFDGTWESVMTVIPEMASDSILLVDTVKLGRFKGRETIIYVEKVMDIYEAFKQIVPFSQDQPSK